MIIKKTENITIVYSQKKDGNMKSSFHKTLLPLLKIRRADTLTMKQVHSAKVEHVDNKENSEIPSECDAIFTTSKEKTLAVYTADCLPIAFFDKESDLHGVIHAGYKGLINEIVENTIQKIKEHSSSIENLIFYIGPSIGDCCYSVSEKRAKLFTKKHPQACSVTKRKDTTYLDLKKYAKYVLQKNNIPTQNIIDEGICTCCSNEYFSYRKKEDRNKLNCTIIKRND